MRCIATIGALSACVAPPALAQDPDVTIDPDSPSAKEYAIPLQSARQQATGEKMARLPQAEADTPPAPLFGVGIGVKPTEPHEQTAPAHRRTRHRSQIPESLRPVPLPPAPTLRALAAPPDGGAGEVALLGIGGAAVLVIGTALGIALRRRRR